MQFKGFSTTLLLGAVQALDMVTTDATSFGAMLARGEVIAKRQGYTPEQRNCGLGNSCQEACGPTYVQCPSTDNRIHCHQPSTGTHCCTDGTGNACRAGYYCTTDGRGKTYCCPDGIQNAECARLYSLTISLIRDTSLTALPTVPTVRSSLPAVTPVLSTRASSLIHVSSSRPANRTSNATPSSRAPTSIVLPSSKSNGTVTASRTSSKTPEFTGAAAKIAGAAAAVVVGAVGFAL